MGGSCKSAAQSARTMIHARSEYHLCLVGLVIFRSHYGTALTGTEREFAPELGKVRGGTAEKFIFLP